jgi:hypothetical protein
MSHLEEQLLTSVGAHIIEKYICRKDLSRKQKREKRHGR